MSILRWAILGPGRITPRIVRAVAATERAELVAVGSRDAERARSFAATHGIARSHGTYEALLDDPDVDVVYVAVPNHLHVPWTLRALEAGKHVLCEKPIALEPGDVDAIIETAARHDRIAVEAFMYLHHPQIVRAVELARDGTLGTLQTVAGSFSFVLTHPGDPRADLSMGGGSLWDVGCYPVSFARRVAGRDPADVEGFARFDEAGIDRTFIGSLAFEGGPLATFDCGFASVDRERLEVVGSEAALVLETPFLPEPEGRPASLTLWRDRQPTTVPIQPVDQYRLEVADLTAAILDGTPPHVDLAFSRGNIATLAALDRVARAHAGVPGRP